MGGWLCRHLFAAADWDHVVLLDRDPGIFAPRLRVPLCGPHRRRPLRRRGRGHRGVRNDDRPLGRVRAGLPRHPAVRAPACRHLSPPRPPADSIVFDTSSAKVAALATLRAVRHDVSVFGIHPLFGPTVKSMDGQTVVVCPSRRRQPPTHGSSISSRRRAASSSSPAPKNTTGSWPTSKRRRTRRCSPSPMSSPTSGHDIEAELWKLRTPVFETLLGLAARVLTPGQEETTASIELSTDGARVAAEFDLAHDRLRSAVRTDDLQSISSYIASTREAFGGTFFTTLQQASNLAVEATQVTRTQFARRAPRRRRHRPRAPRCRQAAAARRRPDQGAHTDHGHRRGAPRRRQGPRRARRRRGPGERGPPRGLGRRRDGASSASGSPT